MSDVVSFRPGRRGACLLALGWLEFVYGLAMILEPAFRYRPGLGVVAYFIPGLVLGFMWFGFGLATMAGAFLKTPYDRHGFRAAYPMPLLWAMNYFASVATGDYIAGWLAGVAAGTIWLGYAFIVLTVSGMVGVEDIRNDGR